MVMYIIKCKNGNDARHLWGVLRKIQKGEGEIEQISSGHASEVIVWLREIPKEVKKDGR